MHDVSTYTLRLLAGEADIYAFGELWAVPVRARHE
jgi:hypothetical protein